MKVKKYADDLPFLSVNGAAIASGLSEKYLRTRIKRGEIPYINVGREYRINMSALYDQLKAESTKNLKGVVLEG